jgi:hypothetical protein
VSLRTLGVVLCALGLSSPAMHSKSAANGPHGRVAAAPSQGLGCDTISAYHALDFWVGEWVVTADGQVVGHNRIDKVVHGCALIENWTDTMGGEGKSLFYYQRARQDWKQVWVDAGGVKEKHVVGRYEDGSIRFQGELPRANGTFVLDRTTLSPLRDGTVRQVIEQSVDGGKTWVVGFDAIYRKAAGK